MKRRDFMALLAGAAAVGSRSALAQSNGAPVIGYLSSGSPAGFATRLEAFRNGLQESGFREGHNVAIEYRWAEVVNLKTASALGLSIPPSLLARADEVIE